MSVDRTSLPVVGPDAPFRLPEFQRTALVDGTRLWTVRHSCAPVLTVCLLLPSGAAADPPGQAGLAALTADLLDEGSAGHSAIELHEALSRIGGRLNTVVTSDATVLSLTLLARHAHRGLALLSEVATTPQFEVEDVERVRDLRLNRLRQLRQAPAAMADRVFLESLYGSHPYGHLAIGTDTTLSALGRAEVVAFHKRWYARSPWTLIAVGDVPTDELRDAVDDVFGGRESVDKGGAAMRSIPDPPPAGDRMFFVPRQDAVQSEIRIGHAGVARRSPDYYALRVLNMVLGGQFVSRINLNLREAKGYTYGARTSFDWRVGRGPFSLQASVQTQATVAAIGEAIREITDIRDRRPATEAEVVVAQAALTRGFPRSFETAAQIARAGLQLALHGLDDDEFTQFVPRILAVDPNEVSRVASLHLHLAELRAVVVGSPSDVLDGLASLGLGTPVECPNADPAAGSV